MPTALGITCSSKEFSFAIMDIVKGKPKLICAQTIKVPIGAKNFYHGPVHKWFYQEISDIITKFKIDKIIIKKYEGRPSRSNAHEFRLELEGIVHLAGANQKIPVFKKPKVTLAKDICGKGKAKYLQTQLPVSQISNFGKYKTNEQEAIICAWSEI